MAQRTDLKVVDEGAHAVLLAVADHFTATHPTDVLEQHSLLIAFGAEAYKLTDRSLTGGATELARTALALAPAPADDVTRGEYALILRRTVAEAGHDWPDGENDPAIPRITGIPGPRTEPTPVAVPRPRPEQQKGGAA
ncbi:hypothetical protein [Streptomyces sp. 2P-4]|uniref:hypothetical protein n=1 Tax=Streptomyces sp. 2P-4 TaxID=2931974 RepID=UPI00253FBECA|nr:hypothetical protein [Streptomyces sp. 2P-4]